MSEYGIKIKNFQAGSLYGYNIGVRDRLDCTNAMLTNSLFCDFLLKNNLTTTKNGESTRDIICIEFEYGTRSYSEELKNFEKKEGFYFIMTNNASVEKIYIFQTF